MVKETKKKILIKSKEIKELTLEETLEQFRYLILKLAKSWFYKYEIDDLIQIGNLSLMTAYNTYDQNSNIPFLVYAKQIIKTQYIRFNRLDRSKREIVILNKVISDDDINKTENIDLLVDTDINIEKDVIDGIDKSNLLSTMRKEINKLNDYDKHILSLRYFQKKTQQEVADILNKKRSTVAMAERKILRNLYTNMEAFI